MVLDSKLDAWIAEGEMDIDRIFEGINESLSGFGFDTSEAETEMHLNFDALCRDIDGTHRLTETAFRSFLYGRGAIPRALMGTTSIIFQSMRYLSRAPFLKVALPEALTFDELCRAVVWPYEDRSRHFCEWRSPADFRRIMFQSLATTEDGKKLLFDLEDWTKQAARRAVEFPACQAFEAELKPINCDEEGDEMFHDAVDTLFSHQPDIDCIYGNVRRDYFRPLARKYQGGGFCLHELTIQPERLHALVKLLLIAQFGPFINLDSEGFPDLDMVTSCIVKTFHRNPDVGITWPMFDDAARGTPFLFTSLSQILSIFTGRLDSDYYLEDLVPQLVTTFLTFPITMQLCLILRENIYWEGFRQLHRYYPEVDPVEAPTIVDNITSLDDVAVLLISGKIIHTGEEALFGAFIPVPSKDGYEIQERHDHWPELFSCLIFELSTVHDVSWGNIGRPGWSVTSDELCFGEKDNGAALVLEKGLKEATFTRNAEQKDPVYTATAWRANGIMEVDVEAIEIWSDLYSTEND